MRRLINVMSVSRLEKIEKLAERRDAYTEEEVEKINSELNEAIKAFSEMCLSSTLPISDRFQALRSFVKHVPDMGYDMLQRLQDGICFMRGTDHDDIISLLQMVIRSSDFSSHARMTCATTLYNQAYLHVCYEAFCDIACDETVILDYRVDACRYLFGSDQEEYKQTAQDSLLEVIDTTIYDSEYRYNIIAGYISRTGINTRMNFKKIKVAYDEYFVYGLQTNFFYNTDNGVRERILSGQHMLQMRCVETEEKETITNLILDMANDESLSHRERADAADVILREGATGESRKKARIIIRDLGMSAVEGNTGSIMDRAKTIYNNQENIHEAGDIVDSFVEKVLTQTATKVRPYHEVHTQVTELMREKKLEGATKFAALKALNRISIDTATFTNYKVNMAEIFVHVWTRIQTYEEKERKTLEGRLIEELCDMGDTCSSGHSARLVNVLSEFEVDLRINWKDQIIANIAGRLHARVRDISDPELRCAVAMGGMDSADYEEKLAYYTFITDQLALLKEEMWTEFVGDGYIDEPEFEDYFDEGSRRHIPPKPVEEESKPE